MWRRPATTSSLTAMTRAKHPHPPTDDADLLKRAASSWQPDVWKTGEGGRAHVLKTYERSHVLLRKTVCAWLIRREARNLRILEGINGVPQYIGRPAPWTLEMTWLDAEHMPEMKHSMEPEWFDDLAVLLRKIHRRGLNFGDLRRKNLMRSRVDGSPCLVDFAQCMHEPDTSSLFHRIVMRRAFATDDATLLKLKKWYCGGPKLTPEEQVLARNPPRHLRFGRWMKRGLYAPLMRLLGAKPRRRRKKKKRR